MILRCCKVDSSLGCAFQATEIPRFLKQKLNHSKCWLAPAAIYFLFRKQSEVDIELRGKEDVLVMRCLSYLKACNPANCSFANLDGDCVVKCAF